MHDLLHTDLTRAYPHLAPMAKISLYDVAPQILGSFDQGLIKCISFMCGALTLNIVW